MNTNGDYVPRKDREFRLWAINLIDNLAPLIVRLGISAERYARLVGLRDAYVNAQAVADDLNARTKMNVQAKNTARGSLERAIRQIVRQFMAYNPDLNDADRERLGLPIHKTTRTPVPVPTATPYFNLVPHTGSRVTVHYYAHDEKGIPKQAKPPGVRGVEIAWAILETPPRSYEDLVHSKTNTVSPYVFQFNLFDAGQRLYVGLRWENTHGEKGPWSVIQSVIVP
jgi:hypothetical protein